MSDLPVLAVVVPADPTAPVRAEHLTFAQMQAAVGGWIEVVRAPIGGVLTLVNEDGRLTQLPPNGRASAFAARPLVGDVVLVRGSGAELADAPVAEVAGWTGWHIERR